MRSVRNVQKRTWFLVGSFMTIMIFALAACGASVGSGSTSTASTPVAHATSVSAYGCPGAVMSTPPAPANVVLKQTESNSIIKAKVGDVIEVDLPFGQSWSGPTTSQGELQLQTPAGYALPTAKVCVWRFTAQGTGTTQLEFYGRAICGKGALCPLYIRSLPFTLVIK
ncbi:MAG TPA: hypothetical protein VKR83_01320 [Ktedonobacteraceae bacterium]|nr:hypothetical protein [Ktedonobacteraceae bacterium]